MTYTLLERLPTIDEYRSLCTAVGWGHAINFAVAPWSLAASVYGVVIRHGAATIGMGRIVGDGAMYFYIQDVAVLPAHQRQGVGWQIVTALLQHIEAHAHGPVFVGLFATAEAHQLYADYGFSAERDLTGMFHVIEGRATGAKKEATS